MMWQPIAEEAACRGITRLDLGYGQDECKFGLANASYAVAGGAVWAGRWEQAARRVYRKLGARPLSRRGDHGDRGKSERPDITAASADS
jgi:hypothetical protein